jgi:hypothetical protein
VRAALVCIALAVPACWHAGGGDPRAAASDPRDDVLAYIPANAQVVFGVDGARVRGSAVWRRLDALANSVLGKPRERFRDRCGYDLFSIERATVAMWDLNSKMSMVAVVHGIDPSRVETCLRGELRAVATPDAGMWHLDIPYWGAGEIAVIGTTSILYVSRDATASTLDAMIRAGAPLRRDEAFARLVRELPDGAAAWVVGRDVGGSKAPQNFTAGVVLDDGATARATAIFADPREAAELRLWGSQLQTMFTKLDVAIDGAKVIVHARATGEQVEMMIRKF